MKPVLKTLTASLLGLTLAGLIPAGLAAQQPAPPAPPKPGEQPAPQQPPTQPGQLPSPEQPLAPPVNPAEDAAYRKFSEIPPTDTRQIVQLGEEFLKSYPESRYRVAVYAKLTQAYWNAGEHDKMVGAGEKTLQLNPDHVDVLSILANTIPRRLTQDAAANEQLLQKTERYATRAIQLLEQLQQPADLTAEQFESARAAKLSMSHSGLGLVYFHRQRYAEAIGEFEKATQLVPDPDPTDYFLLGLSYANASRNHEAAAAFEKCSKMDWPWQDRCKAQMEAAKKRAANELAPPKP